MTATSIHAHEVRAKEAERAELARQLEAWRAAGNIPELVREPARQEKMSLSQEARNDMTWRNRNEA